MSADLIILGASARAAAFSALRAGLIPYAIDQFADCDLCDTCQAVKIENYPADFATLLASAPSAPWIYTGGLENYPRLVAQMAAMRPLYGNPAEVLREVRKPEVLAKRLREAGLAVPALRTSPPVDPSEDEKWLRKPRHSSAGLGIRWHQAGGAPPGTSRSYYQKFIAGASCSAVFVAHGGECELLGATDQQSGSPGLLAEPFLYAGSAGPRMLSAGETSQLQRLGEVLTGDFDLRGLFNVDYVDDGAKIWPLEVNPRYSASIEVLEYALGESFLARHVAQFGPKLPKISKGFNLETCRFAAKGIVYAPTDCRVTARMHQLRKEWNSDPLYPFVADIPREGDLIRRGHPVVTVLAKGPNLVATKGILAERMSEVLTALSVS